MTMAYIASVTDATTTPTIKEYMTYDHLVRIRPYVAEAIKADAII